MIEYLHAARIDDVLRIETKIDGRSSKCFWVNQKAYIKASGKTAIKALITNVFIDAKGRPQDINSEILRIWPDLASTAFKDRDGH